MATKVLVIGVGSMGSGMALHLASQPEYRVLAFDQHAPTLERFTKAYEQALCCTGSSFSADERQALIQKQHQISSMSDVVNAFASIPSGVSSVGESTAAISEESAPGSPDVLIMMVVNSDQIDEFLFSNTPSSLLVREKREENADQFIDFLPPACTILVMSTCAPSAVVSIASKIKERAFMRQRKESARDSRVSGVTEITRKVVCPRLIDAPVSGGPVRARSGELSIMMSLPSMPISLLKPPAVAVQEGEDNNSNKRSSSSLEDGKTQMGAAELPKYMQVLHALSEDGKRLYKFPALKPPLVAHGTSAVVAPSVDGIAASPEAAAGDDSTANSANIGAGSMAKTLHQLLAGVHIASAAEALNLAYLCGIDLPTFYGMVTGAAGNSWMFGDRGQRMIQGMQQHQKSMKAYLGTRDVTNHGEEEEAVEQVEVKSRMTIFIKDLGIVLTEAQKIAEAACSRNTAGAELATFPSSSTNIAPLAELAHDAFKIGVEMGLGDGDDSSLWQVYNALATKRLSHREGQLQISSRQHIGIPAAPAAVTPNANFGKYSAFSSFPPAVSTSDKSANSSTSVGSNNSSNRGNGERLVDVDNMDKTNMEEAGEEEAAVFAAAVEVADEPSHNVKIHNKYTRALLVQFPEGCQTLPHTHSKDSVYIFLSPKGARVRNHVKGSGCACDFMEFGEVRYGYHCKVPLTHRIYAEIGGGGVLCVDAEVLSPPPLVTTVNSADDRRSNAGGKRGEGIDEKKRKREAVVGTTRARKKNVTEQEEKGEGNDHAENEAGGDEELEGGNNSVLANEIESMPGHQLVKVREKVRVFKLTLEPNSSLFVEYPFFHLTVVCQKGEIAYRYTAHGAGRNSSTKWAQTKNVGDMEWNEPVFGKQIENVGDSVYSCFIVQWRNFEEDP